MISILITYLVIGAVFTLIVDQLFKHTKIEEPFTTGETLISIVFWPLMIASAIYYLMFGGWRD